MQQKRAHQICPVNAQTCLLNALEQMRFVLVCHASTIKPPQEPVRFDLSLIAYLMSSIYVR